LAQERQRREVAHPRAASLGRSASGDPSFAPAAPAAKNASPKAASRRAAARKDKGARDAGVKPGASSAASADVAR